jgi:hypothetical protein
MILLRRSIQEKDVIEHINGTCHAFVYIQSKYARIRLLMSRLVPSVICVHSSQPLDHCVVARPLTLHPHLHLHFYIRDADADAGMTPSGPFKL